ncbi:MAG: hypothetical protein JWN66_1916 [Sphingomonas bacterium]|uniref:DUF6311 domain-containing protein n=1 Tax=Sphingomonas bacterium TaxID=1895847 RepID=UPI00262A9EBD|nr:DUF6311 domain-containing protein [Sphingomonas bacterium]MDB5704800.1 hypothetical protein [Sphingomonas bacterium]
MRQTFPSAIALVALSLLVFMAWMHPSVLDPGNVGWLLRGSDRGQAMIGLTAYLREGGPWPITHTPLLGAPDGTALLLTDSIPLLGIALKPFAGILPDQWQYVGPWFLLCLLLQVTFAWKLIRPHAPDALSAWLGTALLTALPVLINRWVHASLSSQWLILWALWLFLDRDRPRRPLWWALLLAVTALIHNYLLLMVAGIWASAVLRDFIQGPGRLRTAIVAAATMAMVVVSVATLGVFDLQFSSTGSYGAFPMAVDAWWNPANPSYTALLPSTPIDEGRGFEGLQYLGAGMLALVVLAIGRLVTAEGRATLPEPIAEMRWLLPAFAVLLLLAIGPQPLWRGDPLTTVMLPRAVTDLLDPIRAAGRLAWPVTYALALSAVLIACRMPRATLILGGALALQVIDLTPMFAAIRATTAPADERRIYVRTPDPRWKALVANAGSIDFEPPRVRADLPLMHEVTLRAILACRPVNFTYTARETPAAFARLATARASYLRGEIDPRRLYVLLGDRIPAALASRVRMLDGVAIIPASLASPPPACGKGR